MRQDRRQPAQKAISRGFNSFVHGLARSNLKPLARVFLEGIRIHRREKLVQPDPAPAVHPEAPTGPYATRYPEAMGELLLFVPRSIESHLIDQATGAYGYSHAAVDCGELDLMTNRRVMVESTVRNPVWRSRQDRYGNRPYLRIPLAPVGVDVRTFCDCVKSRLGEQYDDLEALTWGAVDDPAKQICSDLAADCLPPNLLFGMARAYLAGKLRKNSLSIHPHEKGRWGVFVSPNGFAEYFGAPVGNKIRQPGERITPQMERDETLKRGLEMSHRPATRWAIVLGLVSGALIGWFFLRRLRRNRIQGGPSRKTPGEASRPWKWSLKPSKKGVQPSLSRASDFSSQNSPIRS